MRKAKLFLICTLLAALLMLGSSACADSISQIKTSTNADGSISVSWASDSGSDPVAYVFCMLSDPSIEYITAARSEHLSATLYGIMCGYDYRIELYDDAFNYLAGVDHTVHHEDFTDLKTLKLEAAGIVKMDAGENKFRNKNIVKKPNAETISKAVVSGSDHRFYIKLYTPSIAKGERSYIFTLAVTAPGGYTETFSSNFVLENVSKRTDWTIWPISLEPFCKENALTAGKYTVRLYLDGGLVDTKTITFR